MPPKVGAQEEAEVIAMRLLTSYYHWALCCAALINNCCDEVSAVASADHIDGLNVAQAGPSVAPGVSHLDVWAGVSSFSDAFAKQSHVTVRESAWIEWAPAAVALLLAFLPSALWCVDFFSYAWQEWKFSWDLIVTAGPSCCPFSISGKRLRQKDPRASQGLETAKLAVQLGALVLIMENVVNFLDEEHLHHLVGDIDDFLVSQGMVPVGCWRLNDADLGGASGRERVFLRWEAEDMASCLPPLNSEPSVVDAASLLEHLDPWAAVKMLQVGGQSVFEASAPEKQPSLATRVGSLWIRGPVDEWMPGEALKLEGDHRLWRILVIEGGFAKIIFDERSNPKFRWICLSSIPFSQRRWLTWPVYCINGCAKAIRHSEFAPGDLYLDRRGGYDCVRPLSGREKWRLSGLDPDKANWLEEQGLRPQLGPLAGNSIPARMTEVIVEDEMKRLAQYKRLLVQRSTGGFITMEPLATLHRNDLALTLLVFVGLSNAEVLVWRGSQLPGMVHAVSQQQAFDQACGWASGLGCDEVSHCVLLEREMGRSKARAVIHYGQELPIIEGAEAVLISDVMHLPVGELATRALVQVLRMVREVSVGASEASTWVSGRVSGTAAYQPVLAGEPTTEEEQAFLVQWLGHEEHLDEMRAILKQDGSEDMMDWEPLLCPTDMSDFPANLRKPMKQLEWCGMEIPDPHKPVNTEWLPLPKKQNLPVRPAPQGWLSAVLPKFRKEAKGRVCAFQKKLTMWLGGKSERPAAVVVPGAWLEHWVFEAPHEFHSNPGFATPVDVSVPSGSHLNLDFYADQGADWPDQELLSFLVLGVRYKADIPVQIVLQPHLQSFIPVQDKYLTESDRFIARGWTVRDHQLLLVPFFSAACGSVCRPLEPDRPRCTNDAGAPRKELWADDGVRVRSLNECISESFWPKEVKPMALDVTIAMRVLKEAADLLGTSVFVITDDYKSFFNQLRLAKSEYCKSGVMHPPRHGEDRASFAYDTVLGFGINMASNVAQRFADFIVSIFRKAIRPAVGKKARELKQQNSNFSQWWRDRLKLGELQASLVSIFMYCDDPCILAVGPDMAYECLKAWNWMAKSSNTMMAIPEKRSFGLASKWIGIKFFVALGVCAVPGQKVLRACSAMEAACDGLLNHNEYRSLIGFLEHVRGALFLRGDKMYGLYDALNRDLEPLAHVECNFLMHQQFHRMKNRLVVQAGSSIVDLPSFVSGKPMASVPKELPARRIAIFSDAAKEGTDKPGLGGWILGYAWTLEFKAEHLELDIPVLEAVAAVVNIVCAHQVMGGTGHLPEGVCFEAHVDAQATAHVLIKGKARAPMMQLVHAMALQIPEFVEMLPFLIVSHCLGLGNVASDAASRGYTRVLHIIAESLSLKLITMPPPAVAGLMLSVCLDCHRASKLQHEFCWGAAAVRFGEAAKPGPYFEPMQSCFATDTIDRGQAEVQPSPSKRRKHFVPWGTASAGAPAEQERMRQPRATVNDFLPRVNVPMPHGPMSSASLATALWRDCSDHAICSGNWEQLLQACEVALGIAGDAFAQRTSEADVGHWKAWSDYCKAMGTDPFRPAIDPMNDRLSFLREVVLLVNALLHFMKTRRPRSRADKMIKPQSAMNILLGANRVMRSNFASFIPLSTLKLPLKGLMKRFVQRFGPSSLIPKRREPFTNGMICSLASLPIGMDLGRFGRLTAGSRQRACWRAAVALATSTGFRKAEMFRSNETTFFITWDNFSWIIAGVLIKSPSDEELQALKEGDYLAVSPPPSKADQTNMVWGAHPLYLPFHEQARNAAAALRDLALDVSVGARGAAKPVFVGGDNQPVTADIMAEAMCKAMAYLVGPQRAKLYTWHSARVSLATHLLKCKVAPATIQAILRWQTDESLRAYARLSMDDYARHLDRAANATIAAVQSSNMPIYERFDFFLAMHTMAEEA